MEDSSANPFIPGSSENLQRKVSRPQTPFARISKLALMIIGGLIALIGFGLVFILLNTSSVDEKARADLATTLQPTDQLSKLVTIKSSLGFTVSYQDQLFTSHGELGLSRIAARGTGDQASVTQSYENNDLKKEREYGLVRIIPIESSERARAAVALPPELEINSYDKKLLLQTDEQKAADAEKSKTNTNAKSNELAVSTFVAIDTKKRLGERTSDDGTIVTIEATKPVRQEIAGTEYQKVRYTTRNETYEIATEKFDDCYYTIQNGEPYSACVTNVRPNKVSVGSLLEDTIRLISYQAPAEPVAVNEKTATKDAKPETEDSGDEEIDESKDTEQLLLTPEYVKNAAALKSIAKNQPNIMRIGTLYCADIALKQADGSTGTTLTDACARKVSSGIFISKTGHIATAGHAARYHPKEAISGYINMADSQDEMLERLQRVLDYLLKARIIHQNSVEYLKTGAKTGNQDALAKIENIGSIIPSDYVQALNENYSYALQLTDKPIVINNALGNKPSFAFSDTVVAAEFVKSDYDATKYSHDTFEASHSPNDVALLKIKLNGMYPVTTIGAGDGLGANQNLVTLGYPAFVDSSLTADKILNIPIATTSSVNQTFDLQGRKIIDVNAPIPPGNDGAPVFNDTSALVGFAAYGPSYCPDRQCFGSGTVRSSNDLSALIDKHNIELENKSNVSDVWSEGVDAYFIGNYQLAASKFAEAGKAYGFNQWANKLVDLSKSKFGSKSDTSLINQLGTISIATEILLVAAAVILGILLFIHLKRLDMLQVGHYGADAATVPQSTVLGAAPQQYGTQPQPMQQQPWQQQAPVATPQYPPQQAPAQNQWQQQPAQTVAPVEEEHPQIILDHGSKAEAPVQTPDEEPKTPEPTKKADDESSDTFYKIEH